MALRQTSSLFYKEEGYFVGSIVFDLLMGEEHSMEAEVSQHPVENGATVSDHIRNLPRKGSLTGFVTNHPLNKTYTLPQSFMEKLAPAGLFQNYAAGIAGNYGIRKPTGPTQADFAALQRPTNRAANTWELFKTLMAAKQPVVISTGLEKYRDVVVTKVATRRSSSTGDALEFDVEFQEIQFVTLAEVAITTTSKPLNLSTDANKQGTPTAKKGKVGGKTIPLSGSPAAKSTAKYGSGNSTSVGRIL